jgi:hypothetical protein
MEIAAVTPRKRDPNLSTRGETDEAQSRIRLEAGYWVVHAHAFFAY